MIDVDLDDYPLPEPKEAHETDAVLFDSACTYTEQLNYYKAFRNGHGTPWARPNGTT